MALVESFGGMHTNPVMKGICSLFRVVEEVTIGQWVCSIPQKLPTRRGPAWLNPSVKDGTSEMPVKGLF